VATGAIGVTEMPLNDQLFLILSKTIKKLAEQSGCVIVGRCRLHPAGSSGSGFRVHPCPDRRPEETAIDIYQVAPADAEDVCLKNDKKRANFYNYYSDRKWGMCRTYDLSLDSGMLASTGA
jgi:hypothetical protein